MADEISALIDRDYAMYEVSGEEVDEPAIGGTLFGNALSMAAARAALLDVWTEETYRRMQKLAGALADGMESVIRSHGRDWNLYRLGNRAGHRFAPRPPRNNQEAGAYDLPPVRHLQRVYMANRGIWDFGWWGGPAISAQTTAEDVDVYLGVFAEFVGELLAYRGARPIKRRDPTPEHPPHALTWSVVVLAVFPPLGRNWRVLGEGACLP